jgi:BirA family biotin operon repressor/biotin-[acetyl-CoA-carboxylase] ligase
MAGLAAYSAIRGVARLPVDIRWTNDLLLNGKKVCGILTEMSAELDRLHAVVLGVGINVNHRDMPADLKSIGTSLRIEGRKIYSRAQILVTLLKELERHYRALLEEGGAPIVTAWSVASSFAKGKRVRVLTGSGEFVGTTDGLEPSGALRVRREDGSIEPLVAGEVVEVK